MDPVANERDMFLAAEPVDSWGVAYDLLTHALIDDLPHGWHVWSSTIYDRVINVLTRAGYGQHQYSGYVRDDSTAVDAWLTLMAVVHIPPRGIVQTAARNLFVYRAPHRVLYDGLPLLQPGAALFPRLPAPAPAGLLIAPQHFAEPPVPLEDEQLVPREVRVSVASRTLQNWRR